MEIASSQGKGERAAKGRAAFRRFGMVHHFLDLEDFDGLCKMINGYPEEV